MAKKNRTTGPLAYKTAVWRTTSVFFFTLRELGYSAEEAKRIWDKANSISASIRAGYASYEDMSRALKNEYDIEVT